MMGVYSTLPNFGQVRANDKARIPSQARLSKQKKLWITVLCQSARKSAVRFDAGWLSSCWFHNLNCIRTATFIVDRDVLFSTIQA